MQLFRKRQRPVPASAPRKVDTLFVIGNGFDIWQGLDTSYDSFRAYYLANRDEIMWKLHIRPHVVVGSDGSEQSLSDVELVYGDPFAPNELPPSFWGAFETSLSSIDAQRLNLFFGKDRQGLRSMRKSVRNAKRILRRAFCGWAAGIHIPADDGGFKFGDNCLFITFNYTDTLERRFGIDESRVFHIHGEASDADSIVFGHADHPQLPEETLRQLGGRFAGLYLIDSLLYETDKHVHDNMMGLSMFLALHGVMADDIRHIYVLGHSASPPDLEYFAFLADATGAKDTKGAAGAESVAGMQDDADEAEGAERGGGNEGVRAEAPSARQEDEPDPLEDLDRRLHYVIDHVGYGLSNADVDEEHYQAMLRRLAAEREARASELERGFFKMVRRNTRQNGADVDGPASAAAAERSEPAAWHFSYHGDASREWYRAIMREFGVGNVTCRPSIEECLAEYLVLSGR